MKILVVVNPRAGAGKAARVGNELCARLRGAGLAFERHETHHRDEGIALARSARPGGADVVMAVGGDGTFNEVSQALITAEGESAEGPDLCLVPAGSGSDLSRTLGLGTDLDGTLQRLRAPPRQLDLGVLEFTPHGAPGERARRAFLNIASVGFSAVIASSTNAAPKWLGGKLTYLGASLLAAVGYRNEGLRITRDGEPFHEGRVLLAAFCNGRYFGGGMKIAPEAEPTDGRLDCVVLGDLNKLETYALTTRIYEGTHVGRPSVSAARGAEFSVESLTGRPVPIELDGETPGLLPARLRILPGAARLRC